MNPIKMLGLMALLALMAMAIVGASSAAAEGTSLCSADESSCPMEKVFKHVHETTLSGKKAVLETGLTVVKCDVLFLGNAIENTESGALVISGNFTYTNCDSCTAEEVGGPAQVEILREGHETATVAIGVEVKFVCDGVSCVYSGEELMGTGKGPLLSTETNGEISIVEQTVERVSGFLCSETGKLTITTTPLSATYVTGSDMECRYRRNADGLYDRYSNGNFNQCEGHLPPKNGLYELFP